MNNPHQADFENSLIQLEISQTTTVIERTSEFRERIAGGDAIKSDAKRRESDTAGVNQQVKQRESNIEQHKSGATGANNWLERADFALDNTDREIDEIKQGVISADTELEEE